MFNPRTDRPELKDLPKSALKPAPYDPPASSQAPKPLGSGVRSGLQSPQPTHAKEHAAPPVPPHHDAPLPASPAVASHSASATRGHATPDGEPGGSKLFIGVNIKLKGVEITDCDMLVIEGQVEATVNSKAMQIEQPGTLTGTAVIDFAEIRGEFSGELTARSRLVVHGTGRVSGTIRYGRLIVEEGGELTGDVKRLEAAEAQAQRATTEASGQRAPASGEGRRGAAGHADGVPTLANAAYPGASRTYSP